MNIFIEVIQSTLYSIWQFLLQSFGMSDHNNLYTALSFILLLAHLIIIFFYLVPSLSQILRSAKIYKQDHSIKNPEPISDNVYFYTLFKLLIFSTLLPVLVYLTSILQNSSLANIP